MTAATTTLPEQHQQSQQPASAAATATTAAVAMTNKRRCSGSALPGEHDQQRRRQRRPSSLCVLPPPPPTSTSKLPPPLPPHMAINTANNAATTAITPPPEKEDENDKKNEGDVDDDDYDDNDEYHTNLRKTTRKNVCSWSSTSSCFSTASSLTSISTPVTATAAVTLLTSHALLLPLDLDDDDDNEDDADMDSTKQSNSNNNDDDETEHEMHQRQWRKRVSRSLGRSASNGDAAKVHQILTDERLRPFLDIDATDDEQDGTTPLIYAACFGKADVVQVLLNAGANVDVQDKRGWTALMWATTNSHSQVVELLLGHGASSNTRSARGRTALDFIDTENEQMIHIMSHLEDSSVSSDPPSGSNSSALRRRKSFRRHPLSPVPPAFTPASVAERHNSNKEDKDDEDEEEEDPLDFYYQSNLDTERSHRELMQIGEQEYAAATGADQSRKNNNDDDDDEEDELASCEASMQSIHKFDWDKCLPDQMFVFSEENIQHILDTAITNLSLPMKTRQEIWVPANIIFLSARFAHYYSSRDLLHTFLNAAVAKINHVLKANSGDVHTLAFWMANLSQLLYYLKKDSGLIVATAEHQLELSELICETYTLLVMDSEQRIDKILEPAMLEHEPIQGLTEQVDFADDWQRRFSFFYRRNSTRSNGGRKATAGNNNNNNSEPSSPSVMVTSPSSPRSLSPQSITSLLSSILYVLQSYEVHPAIVLQAIAQFFHFLSCEMFNRILSNKKYLCRSKALQIRMNVTALEEWMRESQLPSHLASYFNPLVQLLQLLQCVSQLNELMLFVNTMKTFDVLNPLQIKRCVLNYRYEVSEARLPDEVNQYVMQIAEDTVRQQQQQQQQQTSYRGSCDTTRRDSSSTRSAVSRPTSVSSLGSLFMASVVGSHKAKLQQQVQQQQQQQNDEDNDVDDSQQDDESKNNETAQEEQPPSSSPVRQQQHQEEEQEMRDHEGLREWTVEKRDSRYMLPFSLPTTSGWGKKISPACDSNNHRQPVCGSNNSNSGSSDGGKTGEAMSVSDAMCQEFKQKLSAEREKTARERGIVPTIPEEWMDRLDSNLVS